MSENLFIEPVAIEETFLHDKAVLDVPVDDDVNQRLVDMETQLAKLTDAVNQFGQMLDFVVKSVEGMANLVKDKGLAGIMGMAMGGGK